MSELDASNILDDLEQYNEELMLEDNLILSLKNYNTQFRNKILTSMKTLADEEVVCLKNIENISMIIEENKTNFKNLIEENKKINELRCQEEITSSREIYDKEIKEINEEINSFVGKLEKQITSISSSTYYKKLDIVQTNNDYSKYLNDIKENYVSSLDFFHTRKENRIVSLENVATKSKLELEETIKKSEASFSDGSFALDDSKQIKIDDIKVEIEENEKILFNQKILIDSKIEKISTKYKVLLELDVTPIKSHIAYLKQELQTLKSKMNDVEVKHLDTFKLNLQIIDKQLLAHKNKTTSRINEITLLLKNNDDAALKKEHATLVHQTTVFNESMRAKKIEYEIIKNHEINLLTLNYNKEKRNIDAKITLFQSRIATLEGVNNFNEYIQFGELRNNMDIDETKIKNKLDNLKQKIYLVDSIDRLNSDFYNQLQEYQKQLHELSIEYNDSYFNAIRNKIITLTSLEIEKSLILKNYNINSNALLLKKNELYLQIINDEEKHEIILKRTQNDLEKKILSQDIQFSNKKFDLLKNISLLEKELNNQNIINEYDYKLQIKTYNIFENRFQIEKTIYKLYLENIKEFIESTELYFNKYNSITKCSNIDITFSTFKYLTSYLQKNVISLLNKIINVISNRITFEGSVNFQYELNRLINEKEQNERWYSTSLEKIEETTSNYEKTIDLYTSRIESLYKESDIVKNQLIIKDLEVANFEIRNHNSFKKLQQDVEILQESMQEYNKEIKLYTELIAKNRKLILDLDKSIPNIKSKYQKNSANISNQLSTIEKRHKQESSVYYNFITKIENLVKDINQEFNIENVKEQVYTYFKKYTLSIYNSILNFEANDIDVLFNKLSRRHDNSLNDAQKVYEELVDGTNDTYIQDSKRLSTTYSNNIYEIEKKIDKIYSVFEIKKKEILNDSKEKTQKIKSKIRNIEIEQNQRKATFLFDINSFVENIEEYNNINNKNIEKLKTDKINLTKKYFDYNQNLNTEKLKKIVSLESQSNKVISSLNSTYNAIIEEKRHTYNNKQLSYKSRIDELNKSFKLSLTNYSIDQSNIEIEYTLESKNLEKKLEIDLYSLKKSSINKINKENKKFNKYK